MVEVEGGISIEKLDSIRFDEGRVGVGGGSTF